MIFFKLYSAKYQQLTIHWINEDRIEILKTWPTNNSGTFKFCASILWTTGFFIFDADAVIVQMGNGDFRCSDLVTKPVQFFTQLPKPKIVLENLKGNFFGLHSFNSSDVVGQQLLSLIQCEFGKSVAAEKKNDFVQIRDSVLLIAVFLQFGQGGQWSFAFCFGFTTQFDVFKGTVKVGQVGNKSRIWCVKGVMWF